MAQHIISEVAAPDGGGWTASSGTVWAAVADKTDDTLYASATGASGTRRQHFGVEGTIDHTLDPQVAIPINYRARRVGAVDAGTYFFFSLIADDGSYAFTNTIDCAALPTVWTDFTIYAHEPFNGSGQTPHSHLWMTYFTSAGNSGSVQVGYVSLGPENATITASAGANGAISPSGAVSVPGGTDQTFAMAPDAGYRVAGLLVDGVAAGAGTSYTFTAVAADHTIAVTFELDTFVDGGDAHTRLVGRRRTRRQLFRRRIISGWDHLASNYARFETAQGAGVVGFPTEFFKFVVGSTIYRYTSGDIAIALTTADVGTYMPTVVERDAIDYSQEDTAQNVTVRLLRSDPVAQMFIAYSPVAPVAVTIIRKHRSQTEEMVIFVGKVVAASFDGPEASLVCAPISEVFRRQVPGIIFQSQCNWALYGAGCGVAKASFKDSGTLAAVAGTTLTAAVFATRADGWFNNGWIELANGDRRFVINHVGGQVALQSAFPPTLVAGAAIDAYAGCDRSEATCAAKFNNLVRHLGFPRIPTRNPYDGSLV